MGKKHHHKSKKHHKMSADISTVMHTPVDAGRKEKSKKSEKKLGKKMKLEKSAQEKPIKLVLKVGEGVISKETKRKADNEPAPSVSGEFTGKVKSKDHGSKKKKKKRSSSKERKKPKFDEASAGSSLPLPQLGHEKPKKKRDRHMFEISHVGAGDAERSVKKIYIKPILPPSGKLNPEFRQTGEAGVSQLEPSPLQLCLENLHRILQRKDMQGFFAFPVNDAIAPGYSSIITQPMDFSTMKLKIEAQDYKTIEEFRDDFFLMCHNAMVYNASETIYCKAAKKLLQSGSKMLAQDKIRNMYLSLGFPAASFGTDVEAGASDEPIDVDTVEGEENILVHPPKKKSRQSKGESKHVSVGRKILAQVQEASRRVAVELEQKFPKNKIGFLRRKEDGSTTLSVLNPDSSQETLPVNLGSLVGKVTSGSCATAGFKEDKKNKATPVSYLMYGPFGSFAPAYDSSRATVTKEESDLLFSTYGDGNGIHYARSLQSFVKDSAAAREVVDGLLDQLTENAHSKYIKQKEKTEEPHLGSDAAKAAVSGAKEASSDTRGLEQHNVGGSKPHASRESKDGPSSDLTSDSSGPSLDWKALLTLEEDGFDVSFLKQSESSSSDSVSAEVDELQKKLNQTGRLLEVLQEVQSSRLAQRPSDPGSATPEVAIKPSQEEKTIANRVTENLREMTSQVQPHDVTALEAIRAAMGVGLLPATAGDQLLPGLEQDKKQDQTGQKET